jgi:hypothetical protein
MNNQQPRTKNQEHRNAAPTMPDDVVLSVRGVSKKFCRNLRRSMWYGCALRAQFFVRGSSFFV